MNKNDELIIKELESQISICTKQFLTYENKILINRFEINKKIDESFILIRLFSKKESFSNLGLVTVTALFPIIQSWKSKCKIILQKRFDKNSTILKEFNSNWPNICQDLIYKIGVLDNAISEIRFNRIPDQSKKEFSKDLLSEAKYYIYTEKHKDIGAMLLRIIIEKFLREKASIFGISNKSEKGKKKGLGDLNKEFYESNVYNESKKKDIQNLIDTIGNSSHHGNYNFDLDDVKGKYAIIEQIISNMDNFENEGKNIKTNIIQKNN